MANLIGKWELEKSENFDEFIKTLELPDEMKTFMAKVKPSLVISKDGDTWSVLTIMTADMSRDVKFQDGVEFEEEYLPGKKTKVLIKIDSASKVTQQVFSPETNALVMSFTREVTNGKMIETATHKGVIATRTFAKTA